MLDVEANLEDKGVHWTKLFTSCNALHIRTTQILSSPPFALALALVFSPRDSWRA